MSHSPASLRLSALAACGLAALSLAACGSSSKSATKASSGQGGGATPSTAPAAKTGSGGSGGGLKGSVNVCSLMPAATLSQITGKTFAKAEEDDTPSYQIYKCKYTTDPTAGGVTGEQLDLDILGKGGAVGLQANVDAANQVKSSLTALTPVSGIGDKAYGGGIEARLEVLYGDTLIKISGLTEITIDQGKQIISQLHSKL